MRANQQRWIGRCVKSIRSIKSFSTSNKLWVRTLDDINSDIMNDDKNADFLLEKARLLTSLDRVSDSLEAYAAALNLESIPPQNIKNIYIEVFGCAKKAVKINPSNLTALLFYGTSLEFDKNWKEAIAQYEKAKYTTTDPEVVKTIVDRIEALQRKISSKSEQSLF
jgi:tetratricopeptide (TPR) repeat protein